MEYFFSAYTHFCSGNDICILTGDSCCNKAVENKLLEKTKRILKNRVFLVLNQFYSKVDTDKNKKDGEFV